MAVLGKFKTAAITNIIAGPVIGNNIMLKEF